MPLDRAQLEAEWRDVLGQLDEYARAEPDASWTSMLNLVRLSQYMQPKRDKEDQQAIVEALGKLYAQVKADGTYEAWRMDPRNDVAVALLYAQAGRVRGRLTEMRERLEDAQHSMAEYRRLAAERAAAAPPPAERILGEGEATRRFDQRVTREFSE